MKRIFITISIITGVIIMQLLGSVAPGVSAADHAQLSNKGIES